MSKNEQVCQNLLAFRKSSHFHDWYREVLLKSELIDTYDINGCFILRPFACEIWEGIQKYLDPKLRSIGVKNCYFPLFVSAQNLQREYKHYESSEPEVLWATRSGALQLKEPIALRRTSETVIYPTLKKWIQNKRDLPLRLNQWANIVRWESKDPTPFIRTREFLWQEGHTAYATMEEANEEINQIMEIYGNLYEDLLAVPVIKGVKTEKEKFAGAAYTATVEAYIPTIGRGVQAATVHQLGQYFAKIYDIAAEGDSGRIIPYQNCWGLTTRSIGVMIMVHGDDKGLVLPPRIAPLQVIVIPIFYNRTCTAHVVQDEARKVCAILQQNGIRTELDATNNRDTQSKLDFWDLKGVPIRLEVSISDRSTIHIKAVRRDNGCSSNILAENVSKITWRLLETMQEDMLARATQARDSSIRPACTWAEFMEALNDNSMILTPFCGEKAWEDIVVSRSLENSLALAGFKEEPPSTATSFGAKSLCLPYQHNVQSPSQNTRCFVSGRLAKSWTLWARSY